MTPSVTPVACASNESCGLGSRCVAGRCEPSAGRDRPEDDAGVSTPPDAEIYPPCDADGMCEGDSHCIADRCVPFGTGEGDDTCRREASPGPVLPQIQCAWTAPPEGDAAPTFTNVLHTPLVATFNLETNPDIPARPSIVFISDATYYEAAPRGCGAAGTLRLVDGSTCEEQLAATDAADRVNSPVTPAIADLDGDGTPEIVAAGALGGVIAFRVDHDTRRLVRAWHSTLADGSLDMHGSDACQWGSISIYDLDDDGTPEIFFEGVVWNARGVRIAEVAWEHLGTGVTAPIADVDGDGRVELIGSSAMFEWVPGTGFVPDPIHSGARGTGFVAIADFGDYPGKAGDAPGRPEIVVVSSGIVFLFSIGGDVITSVAGATPDGMPVTGGGPPTIADFDGDARPEVGAAFGEAYVVVDLIESRIVWTQPSQDFSSRITGSSVFDFNGDMRAEVVYADECFVRVYDGTDGGVLFSQARRSATWQENPIIADVDGDASAEIVVGSSGACQTDGYCPMVDPIFSGLRCETGADCPSGECDSGYCRCSADSECGDSYGCTAPLAGTPGAGNVCRAFHRDCEAGIRVYRDARDRWASSRPIWNQHAYHVTNIDDDGTVPRTSEAELNWQSPGLDNFRQNVQGGLGQVPGADLVARNLVAMCNNDQTHMVAEVCNRGAVLNDRGVLVVFRQEGGDDLCTTRTSEPLVPGRCETLTCDAPVRAQGVFEAIVDPTTVISECHENNNVSRGEASCLL